MSSRLMVFLVFDHHFFLLISLTYMKVGKLVKKNDSTPIEPRLTIWGDLTKGLILNPYLHVGKFQVFFSFLF